MKKFFVLTLFVVAAHTPMRSHAQVYEAQQRQVGLHWDAVLPQVYVSVADFANGEVRHKLQSGLPQLIQVNIAAYTDKPEKAVAVYASSCRVAFDVWDEVYRIEVRSPSRDATYTARSLKQVLDRCLSIRGARIGTRDNYHTLAGRSLHFKVSAELNPLSRKTVDRIRRWLVRPAGGIRSDEAFFGSFVSLLVNPRVGTTERVLTFRTQSFVVPPR